MTQTIAEAAQHGASDWVNPTLPSTLAFVAVLCLVVAGWVWLAYWSSPAERPRAVGVALACCALVTGLTFAYVGAGLPARHPGFVAGFFAAVNVGAIATAFSPAGTRLARHAPWLGLAAFQLFRLPLELVLHSWAEQGTVPVQMSFSGHNFDIITGVAALAVLAMSRVRPISPRVFFVFNLIGSSLLLAVIAIAALSSPLPIKMYSGPPLLLAVHMPFALIAPLCVGSAMAVHLIGWRALWLRRSSLGSQRSTK